MARVWADYEAREIATPRLLLEPLTAWHADVLHPAASDPALYVYLADEAPRGPKALSRRYGEAAAHETEPLLWLKWAVRLSSRGYVGVAELRMEEPGIANIAWMIFTEHQRKGYAREFVAALVAHAHEVIGIECLRATIDARNVASLRTAASCGFARVATREAKRKGRIVTEEVWEYRAHPIHGVTASG